MRRCLSILLQSAALVLAASSALAQTVHTVDGNQGQGLSYATLAHAVEAAANGDVIVVRPGTYDNLIIHGKSLSVVAEGPVKPHILGASVRNLEANQIVLLAGLRFTSASEAGLQIKNCAGPVVVEDCFAQGGDGKYDPLLGVDGHPGVQVAESFAVSFTGCKLTGGRGADYSTVAILTVGSGAAGCQISGPALAAFYGCQLTGGRGGNSDVDEAEWGGYGASALASTSAALTVVGCTLRGGHGGLGGYDEFDIFAGGPACGSGGNGGNGISASNGGPVPLGIVRTADNTIFPGQPGTGGFGCSDGAPGLTHEVPPGQPTPMGTQHIDLEIKSPLTGPVPISIKAHAKPGTALFLGVSTTPGFHFANALSGVALINFGTTQVLPLGAAGPSGSLHVLLANPLQVPAGSVIKLTTQVAGVAPGTTKIVLGEPANLILLGG